MDDVATWGEMGELTWEQAGWLTWGEAASLTPELIERYTRDIWPVVRGMSAEAQRSMVRRLLDETLPPPLLAAATDPEYNEEEEAALSLWTRFAPQTSSDLVSWVAVIIALLSVLQAQYGGPAEQAPAPAPTVVIQQLPQELRPSTPASDATEAVIRNARGTEDAGTATTSDTGT